MTSGPRAIAIGLVLDPTNLVQPLMSLLSTPNLKGWPGQSSRSPASTANYQARVEGDLPREEPS
jgi:hypothetical protein